MKCKKCGDEIYFAGTFWRHTDRVRAHPAIPAHRVDRTEFIPFVKSKNLPGDVIQYLFDCGYDIYSGDCVVITYNDNNPLWMWLHRQGLVHSGMTYKTIAVEEG